MSTCLNLETDSEARSQGGAIPVHSGERRYSMARKKASPSEVLETYSKFRPTGFDSRGLNAEGMGYDGGDRGDWYVVGVSRTRDSGPLDESNFESARKALEKFGEDTEVHRFGHWGPGWFEIILVRPDTEAASEAASMAAALSDYPILDEEDFSRREWEGAQETWEYMSIRGRYEAWKRTNEYNRDANVFSIRSDDMPDWAFEYCRPE